MGMVQCAECKAEISSSAKMCPKCGKRRTSWLTKAFTWFFIFVGGAVLISVVSGQKAADEAAQQQAEQQASMTPEQRKQEAEAMAKAERLSSARGACLIVLKKSLNDPDSAQIGMTSQWAVEERKNGIILVQPSARAKNAFGAYVSGVWECVTKPENANVRVLSFKQIRP